MAAAAQSGPNEAAHPEPRRPSDMRDLFDIEKQKLASKKEKIKSKSTSPPGGFDPTPLPDAPPGYTVKFTIHKAWNLPVADLQSQSADPFVHSTLVADVPRRHKEDPLLTHRTRTIRKTTEPCWEEQWIVANIPSSGFTLKCRLYDEDWPDSNDRLGNVTVTVPHVDEDWEGFGENGRIFDVRKRSGSKRAYLVKGVTSTFCRNASMTPRLHISAKVLGKSDPPHAQMCTIGPTTWIKHYSPMIGRLFTHTKVNKEEEHDADVSKRNSEDRRTKKYECVTPSPDPKSTHADPSQLPSQRDPALGPGPAQALPPLRRVPPHHRTHVRLDRHPRPHPQQGPPPSARARLQLRLEHRVRRV